MVVLFYLSWLTAALAFSFTRWLALKHRRKCFTPWMKTDSLSDWNASLTDQPGSFSIHHDDPQCTHSRGRQSSEVLSSASGSLRGNNSNRKQSDICGFKLCCPLVAPTHCSCCYWSWLTDNIQVILTSTLIKHYWTEKKNILKFNFQLQEMFFNTHSFTSINLTKEPSEDVR